MNVSIVISTYGEPVWQEMAETRALPSALAQDPDDIVCGHDPDATIAQVRNALAQEAEGGWLCFLDADDELAPGYLEAMRQAFMADGPHEAGEIMPLLTPAVSYVRKGRPQPPKFNDRGIPLTDDNWLIVGTLIRRDLFMEVGGFSDFAHGFEDWSLWAKAWKAGAEIVKVPQAVYLAHINPNSEHRRRWRDRRWQVAEHQRVRAELFPELA